MLVLDVDVMDICRYVIYIYIYNHSSNTACLTQTSAKVANHLAKCGDH